LGGAARRRRPDGRRSGAGRGRCQRGARHRLGRPHGRRGAGGTGAAKAAIFAGAERAAAKRRTIAAPMMGLVARLLGRTEARMAEANERDAAAIAAVHAESFQRGWGEDEVRSLLLDRNVVCHCAMVRRTLVGFILSRLVTGEAEILSVAVAPGWRG